MKRRDFFKAAAVAAVAPVAVLAAPKPGPQYIGKLVFVNNERNMAHIMECYDDGTAKFMLQALDKTLGELGGYPRRIYIEGHLNPPLRTVPLIKRLKGQS